MSQPREADRTRPGGQERPLEPPRSEGAPPETRVAGAVHERPTTAVLVLVALLVAGLAVQIVARNVVFVFDAQTLFSPYFTLVADYARAGQFLLWNPYSNAGSPDMAYVELGSFSPLTVGLAAATGGGCLPETGARGRRPGEGAERDLRLLLPVRGGEAWG